MAWVKLLTEKITVKKLLRKKASGEKITMVTAYDTPFARLVDEAGVDSILVGDSAGMVVWGMENTLSVTLDMMIEHTKAVARAKPRALVVADMPFMSYELGTATAMKSAAELVKAGAEAVKLEGGEEFAEEIRGIIRAGIPVMGHIGLTPQRYLRLGGYRLVGKKSNEQEALLRDALALQEAGVFAIILEFVVAEVAKKVTEKLAIPTICIGSGPYCDGQVLVLHDMLGLTLNPPPFAKRYADLSSIVVSAVRRFVNEVKGRGFPSREHYFTLEE